MLIFTLTFNGRRARLADYMRWSLCVNVVVTKRLFDSKPSCWPVIAATAVVTVALDPFWGLVAGGISEWGRIRWHRHRHA